MGTLATVAFLAVASLSSVDERPPTDAEIRTNGALLVSAPDHALDPGPVYDTEDQEIICPPPTRLRCWIAADQTQDAGAPGQIYCSCRK